MSPHESAAQAVTHRRARAELCRAGGEPPWEQRCLTQVPHTG